MECRTFGHHIPTNARLHAYFFCTAQIASNVRSKKAESLKSDCHDQTYLTDDTAVSSVSQLARFLIPKIRSRQRWRESLSQ
jgi:hypothetical protein